MWCPASQRCFKESAASLGPAVLGQTFLVDDLSSGAKHQPTLTDPSRFDLVDSMEQANRAPALEWAFHSELATGQRTCHVNHIYAQISGQDLMSRVRTHVTSTASQLMLPSVI